MQNTFFSIASVSRVYVIYFDHFLIRENPMPKPCETADSDAREM